MSSVPSIKAVTTPTPAQVQILRARLKQLLGTSIDVPDGHTVAIAHAKVFGPKMKKTPTGEPITISSGPFDNTTETAAHAIARAAYKWHGIQIHEPSWEVEFEAEVRTDLPQNHPPIPYSRVYHMIYTPEVPLLAHKGLSHETMYQPFLSSYYLNITYDKFGRVNCHQVVPAK